MRIREAGDSALLLELDAAIDAAVNAHAIAIAAEVRRVAAHGVRDVVSTYRSVALYFNPLVLTRDAARAVLADAASATGRPWSGRSIEVPVIYGGEDGPDLDDVAAFAGLSPQAVVARHSGCDYRVFMLGFLPGFAYLGTVPAEIAIPRRATPRVRVPRGSVAIGGAQTAVYPRESPGGWHLVGRTAMDLFEPDRVPAALLAPGDTVRFVPTPARPATARTAPAVRPSVDVPFQGGTVTVLRPGLFTTVQDGGRWGHQSSGVSISGALDIQAHRVANALVGNTRDAATLEATVTGPELRLDVETVAAVAGADLGATLDGAALPPNTAASVRKGSVLRFAGRRTGTRVYVALAGGIATPPVLGSRATHVLSAFGGHAGRSLVAGDVLRLAAAAGRSPRRRMEMPRVASEGGARLRVLPGPQDDFFEEDAFDILQKTRFRIAPQSDRMGYRLQGGRIPRLADREMISDATFTGGIQVPASGEPILLMADRQTTGGYPQIATVITADMPLAAQLAPGDWIEFLVCSHADALAALVAQEGRLLALE